jgi:hypothetical protein
VHSAADGGCVDTIGDDMAVFKVDRDGRVLVGAAPGVGLQTLRDITGAPFRQLRSLVPNWSAGGSLCETANPRLARVVPTAGVGVARGQRDVTGGRG